MQAKDDADCAGAPIPGDLSNPPLARFFDEHAALVEDLSRFDVAQLVSYVGGLLTRPEWHGSTLRLKLLQHLVTASARGGRRSEATDLKRWLVELGEGFAGQLEDPAEDVFVSRVILPDRDCLIFDGTDDAPAYYLQRFIDILDRTPRSEPYSSLRRAAHGLLTLSNAVAARAGIVAWTVGEALPLKEVSDELLRDLPDFGRRVVFTESELGDLGVDPTDLSEFIFDPADRSCLAAERLGHTTLDRFPILVLDDCFFLTIPSAVSIAIRRAVIELCTAEGVDEALYRAYTHVIAESFVGMPLLGGVSASEIPFRKQGDLFFANLYHYVDQGRLLHLCFLVDDFRNYAETETIRLDPEPSRFVQLIDQSLSEARNLAQPPEFKEGISVIVACPWGRPVAVRSSDFEDERWRVVAVSVADFATLSWLPKFSPLDLWRLLDEYEQLGKMNIELFNPSGLLNLYAWLESLDAEHRRDLKLPNWDPQGPGPPLLIVIPQNGLLKVRKECVEAWNPHHAMTWDGRNVEVRREQPRLSARDSSSPPLYVSMDDVAAGRFLSVFETKQRGWWSAVETPNSDDPQAHYRLWHACGVWIGKAAPVLEREISSLPGGPIAWICRFEDSDRNEASGDTPNRPTARALLTVETRDNVVHVTARAGFLAALRNPTNIAESLLVEALVTGALRLSGAEATAQRVEMVTKAIVIDEWARDIHWFEAVDFRQFLQTIRMPDPVLVSEMDDAYSRLALGWRVRARSEGAILEGEAGVART